MYRIEKSFLKDVSKLPITLERIPQPNQMATLKFEIRNLELSLYHHEVLHRMRLNCYIDEKKDF